MLPLQGGGSAALVLSGATGSLSLTCVQVVEGDGAIGATTLEVPGAAPRVFLGSLDQKGEDLQVKVLDLGKSAPIHSGAGDAILLKGGEPGVGSKSSAESSVSHGGHGTVSAVFPHVFERRDGSMGYRVVVTTDGDSVALLQPSAEKVPTPAWVRYEALASVTKILFIEPFAPKATAGALPKAVADLTYVDRLQLQQQSLVSTALNLIAPVTGGDGL